MSGCCSCKLLAACAVLLLLGALTVEAGPRSREPLPSPIKPLVPLMRCDVCTELVKHSVATAKQMRADLKAKGFTTLKEDDVMDTMEKMCEVKKDEGGWLRVLHVVQKEGDKDGNKFVLQKHSDWGKCGRVCSTLRDACLDVLDVDALTEELYKGRTRAKVQKAMCDRFCGRSTMNEYKKLTATATKQIVSSLEMEPFTLLTSKEKEVELTVGRMEGVEGMPGMDVYARDEMESMRSAMESGDYDALRDLDDSAAQMSDEDLEMVRQMQQHDDGGQRAVPSQGLGSESEDDDVVPEKDRYESKKQRKEEAEGLKTNKNKKATKDGIDDSKKEHGVGIWDTMKGMLGL